MTVVRSGANGATVRVQGVPGPDGPQGTPGVDAVVKEISTDAVQSRVAEPDPAQPGKVRAAVASVFRRIAGIFTATASSGTTQAIQHYGPVDPNDRNVGAGAACAVGYDASLNLVRVTDAACVSGLNYAGWCDEAGTIFLQGRLAPVANALDFGLDPTGVTTNDAALVAMCAAMMRSKCTTAYFPAGLYDFAAEIDYLPRAIRLVGDGLSDQAGARYYSGSGTRLRFRGAGDAITIGDGTNTSSGGAIEDLEILGRLNTDVDGQSTFQGTEPTGAVDPTNINDRGLHLYGVVGFRLRNVRIGGFKRQISVDGGEHINGEHIEFSGGGDGYGYQSCLDPSHKPATVTANAGTNKYTLASGSWIAQGMKVGRVVNVGRDPHFSTGDFTNPANYGDKTIVAVTDLDLTVAEALVNETATRAWFKVDLGDDSARAIEIGSFDFVVPVSANVINFDDVLYNNSQVGCFHQSGTQHRFTNVSSEIPTVAWLQGAVNVYYETISGEGAQSATFLLRYMDGEGSSSTINLTIWNALMDPHFPLVAPHATKPCGVVCLGIGGSDFDSLGIYGRYPVEGAGQISGLYDLGGNRLPVSGVSEGALCDGYTVSQSGAVIGHSYGHATKARAAHHFNLYNYSYPIDLLSSEGADYYGRNPPATQRGKEAYQWRQVYTPGGAIGTHERNAIGWAAIDAAAASQTTAKAPTPRDGAGVAILTATAHWTSDKTKIGAWQVRCRYSRASGVVTLGTPSTIFADNADGFVAPVLTASSADVVATLTAHATEDTVWSVTIDLLHGGA